MLIQIKILSSSLPFSLIQVNTPSSSNTIKDTSINLSFSTLHSLLFGGKRLVLKKEGSFSTKAQGFLDIKNSFLSKVVLNMPYELDLYDPEYANTYQAYESFRIVGTVKAVFEKAEHNEKNEFSVLGLLVGDSNVSTLHGLKRVFYSFLDGSHSCRAKFLKGVIILWRSGFNTESKAECGDGKKCKNDKYKKITSEFAILYKKLFYHAIASYGQFFFLRSLKRLRKLKYVKEEPRKSILEFLDVPAENLISINLDNRSAPHIVFIDGKDLVISFRGTENADDALKDLNCEYDEFYGGYAHKGFKEIAEAYCEEFLESLKDLCISKNIEKIIFTGHSLGGAIAILVTVILMQKSGAYLEINESKIPISAIAFSPPSVLSADFCSSSAYKNIQVMVYGSDIVPRLSYGSMLDLKFLSISLANRSSLLGNVNTSFIEEIKGHLKKSNLHPKLYLPGVKYHITRGCCSLYSELEYEELGEIIVDSRTFLHHGFGCLVNAFDEVLEKNGL